MKMKYAIYLLLAGVFLASACSKERALPLDNRRYEAESEAGPSQVSDEYNAVVTVKQTAEQIIYFQVDSVTRLYPLNYDQPFTGPKRLACRLVEYNRIVDGNKDWHLGIVPWYDEVAQGAVEKESYQSDQGMAPDDGIDILSDWMTSLEDAFLTLHYTTIWGDGSVAHRLMLVKTGDNNFRLLHYRNGDESLQEGDALICFDLNDCLPRTEGTDITIKWTTGAGESAKRSFRFRSRP